MGGKETMKIQRTARILLIVLILFMASVACITGGGGGDDPDAVATQMAEADAQDKTATFGAQVFDAQLTAIAEGEK